MSQSGVQITDECIDVFNKLKLDKKIKFIIYKLTDDFKQIVVEESSENGEWDFFREKLLSATTKSRTGKVGPGPRYAVYDVQYQLASGEGLRNKISFFAWSPDNAGIQPKMVYASSKEALKRALNGVAVEFQVNDPDDIEWESVLNKVSKGLA